MMAFEIVGTSLDGLVVQVPATAEGRHMPGAAPTACVVDHVFPLSGITLTLTRPCPPAPR